MVWMCLGGVGVGSNPPLQGIQSEYSKPCQQATTKYLSISVKESGQKPDSFTEYICLNKTVDMRKEREKKKRENSV